MHTLLTSISPLPSKSFQFSTFQFACCRNWRISTYFKAFSRFSLFLGGKFESELNDNAYKVAMRLTIKSVSPSDYGTYTCVAKNSLGETDGTIKLYSWVEITFFIIFSWKSIKNLLLGLPRDGKNRNNEYWNEAKRKGRKGKCAFYNSFVICIFNGRSCDFFSNILFSLNYFFW